MAEGFNLSIYFMLTMVSLSLGGFGFLVWRSYRRARAGQAFEPEGKVRWGAGEKVGEA